MENNKKLFFLNREWKLQQDAGNAEKS